MFRYLIRDVKEEDLQSIVYEDFHRTLWEQTQESFKNKEAWGVRWYVVENQNHEVVGTVRFCLAGGYYRKPFMYSLRVKPSERNKGIGTQLIKHVEAEIKKLGFTEVFLQVSPENLGAYRLYERLGYSPITGLPRKDKWSYLLNGNIEWIEEDAIDLRKAL